MKTTHEELAKILQSRWGYQSYLIESTIQKLTTMDQSLQDGFEQFLLKEEYPDEPKLFGLSARVIHENYPFEPPAVFMLMEWIRKEPDAALEALVTEYHKPLPMEFDAAALSEWKTGSKSA
jgi:hypothetical protein